MAFVYFLETMDEVYYIFYLLNGVSTEAGSTAIYCIPTKSLPDKTPFEMWSGKESNLIHFGCKTVMYISKQKSRRRYKIQKVCHGSKLSLSQCL